MIISYIFKRKNSTINVELFDKSEEDFLKAKERLEKLGEVIRNPEYRNKEIELMIGGTSCAQE